MKEEWDANEYTVTLNPEGGTIVGADSFTVIYGSQFSTESTVSKTGYTFEGWYDSNNVKYIDENGNCTRIWDKPSDTTLYAKWAVKSYEIQINADGTIIWLGPNGLSDTSCSIPYGTVLSSINLVPTFKASNHGFKEGKIFDHFEYGDEMLNWSTVPDLGEDNAIITIIPVWINETYEVYFNTNGGYEISSIIVTYGDTLVLPEYIREGYTFIGWKENSSAESQISYSTVPDWSAGVQSNGSVQLFLYNRPNVYSVQYNSNTGSGNMNDSEHKYDEKKVLTQNAYSKYGHAFMGWSLTPNGAVQFANGEEVENLTATDNAIVNLYAVWQAKVYNINYRNLAEGMTISVNTYTYGVGLSEMPILYEYSNGRHYQITPFYGWYSSMTVSNNVPTFSNQVTSISSTQTGNITLYAKYDYFVQSINDPSTHTVTDGDIDDQPCYDVVLYLGSILYDKISSTALNKIKITFSLDIWEIDAGYQEFKLYNGNTLIDERSVEHGGTGIDTQEQNYTFEFVLNLNEFSNTDYLDLKIHASGWWGDDWQFNNFQMSVYFPH